MPWYLKLVVFAGSWGEFILPLLVVAGLFLAQGLLGGANAHYHVEPAGFYGLEIGHWLPYNLTRMWHVQLALFFVSAA